jgi:predicted nucleotidyltransferase
MNTEKEIVEILRQTYNPLSIILHGSQARLDALPKSDWDLYLIVENTKEAEDKPKPNLDKIELDIGFISSQEIENIDINKKFGGNLQDTKVIFDKDKIGENLTTKAKNFYSLGRNLALKEIDDRKNFFKKMIDKLTDCKNMPIVFYLRFFEIYNRLPRYWAEIKINTWSKSPRVLIPQIKQQDEYFYDILLELTEVKNEEKIKLLKEAFEYLFQESCKD